MSRAIEDIDYWQQHHLKTLKKIMELCIEAAKHPTIGKGKPEPLKYSLQNCWSRRIDLEHRLVYRFDKENLYVLQARYHY